MTFNDIDFHEFNPLFNENTDAIILERKVSVNIV
jgi:hypothetical protein